MSTTSDYRTPVKRGAGARPKRKNFSKEAVLILTRWLYTHSEFPYPDAQEAKALCRETNLSLKQLRIWFINNRKVPHPFF